MQVLQLARELAGLHQQRQAEALRQLEQQQAAAAAQEQNRCVFCRCSSLQLPVSSKDAGTENTPVYACAYCQTEFLRVTLHATKRSCYYSAADTHVCLSL
jgi:hypothetical protein